MSELLMDCEMASAVPSCLDEALVAGSMFAAADGDRCYPFVTIIAGKL